MVIAIWLFFVLVIKHDIHLSSSIILIDLCTMLPLWLYFYVHYCNLKCVYVHIFVDILYIPMKKKRLLLVNCHKNLKKEISQKIHPVGSELIHADRWMDRHDQAVRHILQLTCTYLKTAVQILACCRQIFE